MKRAFLTMMSLGVIATTSQAAIYSTNFDSYVFGSNLGGVDGWVLTGATTNPDVASIRVSPFPSPSSGGQALHFGFNEIDDPTAHLYRSSGVSLVGNSYGYTQFQASFTVQDSSPDFPNRDPFAFTFRGASNENLLTISLSPTEQTATPQFAPARVDQFSWSSNFAAGNANIGSLTEGQWSTINVLFEPSGINDVDFTIKFAGVTADTGTLVGAGSQILGTYGFVWTPLDAADEGDNFLIIDDLSLVPEPSSALLLGLAAFGFVTRRRRA